jgi:hypothetical protein
MGPPLIRVTAWHRVGTEAIKSLDVLCCQPRCHSPLKPKPAAFTTLTYEQLNHSWGEKKKWRLPNESLELELCVCVPRTAVVA